MKDYQKLVENLFELATAGGFQLSVAFPLLEAHPNFTKCYYGHLADETGKHIVVMDIVRALEKKEMDVERAMYLLSFCEVANEDNIISLQNRYYLTRNGILGIAPYTNNQCFFDNDLKYVEDCSVEEADYLSGILTEITILENAPAIAEMVNWDFLISILVEQDNSKYKAESYRKWVHLSHRQGHGHITAPFAAISGV